MLDIKISLPGENSQSSFDNFIDQENKFLQNVKFHINTDIKEADVWFIFEDLCKPKEQCLIDPKNIIYLNTETSYPNSYFLKDYMKNYLSQFYLQYGCYEPFNKNYFNTVPFLPWMINYKSNSTVFSKSGKSVDELRNSKITKKYKNLSIICSDKKITDNHRIRYEFAKNLKNYFGNDIEWYGTGSNPIEEKWEGLNEYKYHIVIENGQKNNLISEKLYDSYLGLSFPIYCGAPNINDYFPSESLAKIDINNFKDSIKKIEDVITNNTYENNLESIYRSKELVLGKYNFLNRISTITEELIYKNIAPSKSIIVLESVQQFWKKNTSYKIKAKNAIARKIRLNQYN